jgi:gas vesicle protein
MLDISRQCERMFGARFAVGCIFALALKLKDFSMKKLMMALFAGFLMTGIFAQSSDSTASQGIKEDAREAKTAIKSGAKEVKSSVKSAVKEVKPKAKEAAKEVKEAAKTGAKKVKEAAKEVKEEVKEVFTK